MGAWIETSSTTRLKIFVSVAPRVGAWIETARTSGNLHHESASPPAWGRGLKLFAEGAANVFDLLVAPRVGPLTAAPSGVKMPGVRWPKHERRRIAPRISPSRGGRELPSPPSRPSRQTDASYTREILLRSGGYVALRASAGAMGTMGTVESQFPLRACVSRPRFRRGHGEANLDDRLVRSVRPESTPNSPAGRARVGGHQPPAA